MARIKVVNRLNSDFGMVPRALWRSGLSFHAKAVAAYLLCLRDGAFPYVAEMEAAMSIGRDARRKAFAELEAFGFLEWHIERPAGKIVAKTLYVDPFVFDEREREAAEIHAPETQADGEPGPVEVHAPDFPAGGSGVPAEAETRRSGACGLGDKRRNDKKDRARVARQAVGSMARAAARHSGSGDGSGGACRCDVGDLTPAEAECIRKRVAFELADGRVLLPSSDDFKRLAACLAEADRQSAEKGMVA